MSLKILSCARARVGGLVEQNAMVGAQEVSNKLPPQQVCDIHRCSGCPPPHGALAPGALEQVQ
jgi:hypothetical protein